MKVKLSELRAIVREEIEKMQEAPVTSSLQLKPGMKLRYTGPDMEVPDSMQVLKVNGDVITLGDRFGHVRKITTKDLHQGVYELLN